MSGLNIYSGMAIYAATFFVMVHLMLVIAASAFKHQKGKYRLSRDKKVLTFRGFDNPKHENCYEILIIARAVTILMACALIIFSRH